MQCCHLLLQEVTTAVDWTRRFEVFLNNVFKKKKNRRHYLLTDPTVTSGLNGLLKIQGSPVQTLLGLIDFFQDVKIFSLSPLGGTLSHGS